MKKIINYIKAICWIITSMVKAMNKKELSLITSLITEMVECKGRTYQMAQVLEADDVSQQIVADAMLALRVRLINQMGEQDYAALEAEGKTVAMIIERTFSKVDMKKAKAMFAGKGKKA